MWYGDDTLQHICQSIIKSKSIFSDVILLSSTQIKFIFQIVGSGSPRMSRAERCNVQLLSHIAHEKDGTQYYYYYFFALGNKDPEG